jgi:arylsulfatase A-like enzyme
VDDARDWIRQNHNQPWLLVLSFNAAHTPIHAPPSGLHDIDEKKLLPGGNCDPLLCYRAMVEAMDKEIGILLAWLRDAQELNKTVVIFVSDNGPEEFVAVDPQRSKYTLVQGGVNVPLIVKGPGVVADPSGKGRVSDALINTTDLYMTVLELAGIAPCAIPGDHDSYSFVPILAGVTDEIRHYAYAEVLSSRAGKAIRNRAGLKLQRSMQGPTPTWYLFDLAKDPGEKDNLFDDKGQAPPALQAEVARLKDLLGDENVSKAAVPPPRLLPANLDPDADGVVGPIVEGRACRSDLRAYDLGPP